VDAAAAICRLRIDAIEALLHEEVGRNIGRLAAAARGGLAGAAASLADHPAPRLAVITGFFVPRGTPPAAETDGPVGAALLLRGLADAGLACRLATDTPCAPACAAALAAAGLAGLPLDVAPLGAPPDDLIAIWRAAGVTHALAIERCGRSADGVPRNSRGQPIDAFTADLDALFLAGPWTTLAIGDGGNEIGMGTLPHALVAAAVRNGAAIACATPADHLIVAGVSNWGAWGLAAAIALLRPDWRAPLLAALDPALDEAILTRMVVDGPAVDGITARSEPTVDGFPLARHHAKLAAIRALAAAEAVA
jgi:hypothetical protein